VCGLRVLVPWWRSSGSRSGLQRAAFLVWHSVGDDGAFFDSFLSAPLPGGGGGVALCCVRLFVWCGVRFGALCTNDSSSYMMCGSASTFYLKKTVNEVIESEECLGDETSLTSHDTQYYLSYIMSTNLMLITLLYIFTEMGLRA